MIAQNSEGDKSFQLRYCNASRQNDVANRKVANQSATSLRSA